MITPAKDRTHRMHGENGGPGCSALPHGLAPRLRGQQANTWFLNGAHSDAPFICKQCGHGYSAAHRGRDGRCCECDGEHVEQRAAQLFRLGFDPQARCHNWFYLGTQRRGAIPPQSSVYRAASSAVDTIAQLSSDALPEDTAYVYQQLSRRWFLKGSGWRGVRDTDVETAATRAGLRAAINARRAAQDRQLVNGHAVAFVKRSIGREMRRATVQAWGASQDKQRTQEKRDSQKATAISLYMDTHGRQRMTQQQVADSMEVSRRTVGRWLKETRKKTKQNQDWLGKCDKLSTHICGRERWFTATFTPAPISGLPITDPSRVYGVKARRRFSNAHGNQNS